MSAAVRRRGSEPAARRSSQKHRTGCFRLLARAIGEPHDRERGLLTRAQVGLDLDATRLEADERKRDRAAEHPPTVRPNPLQHCAAYVTTEERGRSPEPLRPEGDSFAREAKRVPRCRTQKKGAGGGNMVSPPLSRCSHLHLPVSTDITVYDAISRSLRQHLGE